MAYIKLMTIRPLGAPSSDRAFSDYMILDVDDRPVWTGSFFRSTLADLRNSPPIEFEEYTRVRISSSTGSASAYISAHPADGGPRWAHMYGPNESFSLMYKVVSKINTYSVTIKSLLCLDPEDDPTGPGGDRDEIVMTVNGQNLFFPWQGMRKDDRIEINESFDFTEFESLYIVLGESDDTGSLTPDPQYTTRLGTHQIDTNSVDHPNPQFALFNDAGGAYIVEYEISAS